MICLISIGWFLGSMLILIRYILPWKLCTNVDLEKGTISKGNFIFHSHLFSGDTPPKFNIAPENRPSQKETHLPTIHFQGLSSTSRGYVSFQGGYCIFFEKIHQFFLGGFWGWVPQQKPTIKKWSRRWKVRSDCPVCKNQITSNHEISITKTAASRMFEFSFSKKKRSFPQKKHPPCFFWWVFPPVFRTKTSLCEPFFSSGNTWGFTKVWIPWPLWSFRIPWWRWRVGCFFFEVGILGFLVEWLFQRF